MLSNLGCKTPVSLKKWNKGLMKYMIRKPTKWLTKSKKQKEKK
jgi:hypothetical protein